MKSRKILITGGTGLVGRKLTQLLIDKKYNVVILSRNPQNENEYKWDISNNYVDENAFKDIDVIIHLAGIGIADKRWSNIRKKEIIDSRVKSTALLLSKIKKLNIPLKKFISTSAIGYYGTITTENIFTEDNNAGNDFLSLVCKKWENAALQFKKEEIPVAIFRSGIVLSNKGGALKKMKTPIISPLGNGKQYLPWIHIDDLCAMYIYATETNLKGIYNAVSSEHHTSKSFSKLLAKTLHRPFIPVGIPSFLMEFIFGEMAILLLEGSRISSDKIKKTGFKIQFYSLEKALKNVFYS